MAVAFVALILGMAYQDDTPIEGTAVVGAERSADQSDGQSDGQADGQGTAPAPTAPGQAVVATGPAVAVDPVERFLPLSGQASACREAVGVDLAPGYAATLTINGISINPDEMNVRRDANGNVIEGLTASRSLGQYTFGPEEDCPNGRVLRPTDNLLQACVYRVEEGPASCVIKEYRFSVL